VREGISKEETVSVQIEAFAEPLLTLPFETTVNGVPHATTQENWRVFAMVAYPITPQQGVSLSIGSGGNYGAGTDFDAITVGYQYSWGEG
jgi:hypothetical protein